MLLFSSELKLPCCDAAADNFHFGAVSLSHLLLSIMNVTVKILKIYLEFISGFVLVCSRQQAIQTKINVLACLMF